MNGTKRSSDKAYSAPKWVSVCRQAHSETHKNGKTGPVQLTGFTSSVDCICPCACVFCPLSVPREQSLLDPAAFDLYLLHHQLPLFLLMANIMISLVENIWNLYHRRCGLWVAPQAKCLPGVKPNQEIWEKEMSPTDQMLPKINRLLLSEEPGPSSPQTNTSNTGNLESLTA